MEIIQQENYTWVTLEKKFDKKHKFDKFVGSINYSDWLSQASPLKKLSSNKNGGPEFYAILYNKLKNDK